MQETIDTKEEFSLLKSGRSFSHAGRGVALFIKTTQNAWIHIGVFVVVVAAGIFFEITRIEWLFIIIVSGFVFTAEAINTAIEIDINLTSPEYHPYARDTKDVSAGAVLISSVVALLVGIIIFFPYVAKIF
jgi:diacylglycerol kinase (ATP)